MPKASPTTGSWIVETDGTGSSGGYIPPDAPPVSVGIPEVNPLYDGRFEVRVPWTPDPTAGSGNFQGVSVYVEDPDMSETTTAPMDGTVPMDGTIQMAGKWIWQHVTENTESPADLFVNGKVSDRYIRVYLQAYNFVVNSTLIRANKPNATPNVRVPIPAAAGHYVSGQEYAWLVSNPIVTVIDNFDNPEDPTYSLVFSFIEPDDTIPLPPGLKPYAGVQTVYEYPSQNNRRAQARFLTAHKPETWISDEYYATTITFLVWFCSVDSEGHVNTIVKGVTPMVQVSVTYPPAGQTISPEVTGLAIGPTTYLPTPDGSILAQAQLTWTNPATLNRFSGIHIYRVGITPPRSFGVGGNNATSFTLEALDWPPVTAESWTIAAISLDDKGRLADDPASISAATPTAIWHIGPPSISNGQYAPVVVATAATVVAEQQLNSDGVVMVRFVISGWVNSTDNKFGGVSIARLLANDSLTTGKTTWWDAPKNQTSFTTDWEPAPAATSWDFWFVSRDQQGNRNQILPGITPKVTVNFTPQAGDVLASRLPKDWFDTSEFQWPDGFDFSVKLIHAEKIFVDKVLRVGGGTGTLASSFAGNQNGQIGVFNFQNTLVGWIGQQDGTSTGDNPTPHSIYGAWFAQVYIGGGNPTTAPIYINDQGVAIFGGFDTQIANGATRYPYISIRDASNVEKGRIGARIGDGLVTPADPAYIAGAWFTEFAVGGQSLADWRILAKRSATTDPTEGSLVQLRNINMFQINYVQNYHYPSGGSNHPNAAYTFQLGYDAYVTDGTTSAYSKFPGLTLVRDGTSHGISLINRGLICYMPNGARAAALVTYNGDPNGGDGGQFWAEMTLYSQANSAINVELSSGTSGSGASFFKLWDAGSNLNFSVDGAGTVFCRSGLTCASLTVNGALTVNSLTVNSAMIAQSYKVGSTEVITAGGQFDGPGGVNTTGDIRTGGQVVGASFYLPGGSQPLITNAGGGQWNGAGGVYTNGEIESTSVVKCRTGFYVNGVGGANGSFVAGAKTVTVSGGIITSIV
ncbi:MAG TPA: hypothetical protein VE030_11290 [Burkholderiales bacterium]|nr:hypothetical protein [Burkholderiales bacterium]